MNNEPKVKINQISKDTGETPLFYALAKIKSDAEKVKMVKLLLER